MTTLLIAVGALFIAVIGWTLLDPWPSPATGKPKNQADEERAKNDGNHSFVVLLTFTVAPVTPATGRLVKSADVPRVD
jgi:hypothetical protein